MEPAPDRQDAAPARIGRYDVIGVLGVGGMATVYLARSVGPAEFKRLFALKVIHPHLARSEEFLTMFLDEARLMAQLRHPNVAPVFEVGIDAHSRFIAMEYVSGEPLSVLIHEIRRKKRTAPLELAALIGASAAEALHAAHTLKDQAGEPMDVVHRDVSLNNIVVGYDGVVRLLDFGVAKAKDKLSLTRNGIAKGTLAYMAPEQILRKKLDQRTDVFALGVVLWELITLRRLFKGENDATTLKRVLELEVPSPSSINSKIPANFSEVVLKALAREPEARFQTARELAVALRSLARSASAVEVEAYIRELLPDRFAARTQLERDALNAPLLRIHSLELAPDLLKDVSSEGDLQPDLSPRMDVTAPFAGETMHDAPEPQPRARPWWPVLGGVSVALMVLLLALLVRPEREPVKALPPTRPPAKVEIVAPIPAVELELELEPATAEPLPAKERKKKRPPKARTKAPLLLEADQL